MRIRVATEGDSFCMDNKQYFEALEKAADKQYALAEQARSKNLDPSDKVEAIRTKNLAERVEGLVGPKYIADEIMKLQKEGLSREKIVEKAIDWILKGTYLKDKTKAERIEQALRTALAILTEGVVSAPLEGISKVTEEKNPDGSSYLAVYFSGPIRGAGGTAAALSVLLADYIRRKEGIGDYRPTDTEIERYKEEIHIYHRRIVRLQYMPSDDEIRKILTNVKVCIDGDPTEKQEVDLYKGLERVKTDRIRGGMCLVIGEGIAQKSKKVVKFADIIKLEGWSWLKELKKGKEQKKDEPQTVKHIQPNPKFLEDIVVGRPIFAYPSRPGAFRLRYGRSNMCGIASKAIHTATMVMLEDFPVIGTQLRVERPGKGMVSVPCEEIEGPIVKLKGGSVVKVKDAERAKEIRDDVEEILTLGDILVPYGDFLNYNETLPESGYVEEWWEQDYRKATKKEFEGKVDAQNMLELSKKLGIPLHPEYTYLWHDISVGELKKLTGWLENSTLNGNIVTVSGIDKDAKRVLEILGVPHKVEGEKVIIEEYGLPLLVSLDAEKNGKVDFSGAKKMFREFKDTDNAQGFVAKLSPIEIRKKVGCYIGARMGRPEKANERKMKPAPAVLFPLGEGGGRLRSIMTAAKRDFIKVEIARMKCPKCKKRTFLPYCKECNERTVKDCKCSCGYSGSEDLCKRCGNTMSCSEETEVPMKSLFNKAVEAIGKAPQDMKGVKGMSSAMKMPEPLEKGFLRALNGVFVFKDGTIRYDATDVPTTHFKPKDIGTSIAELKKLGYEKDSNGKPLENENQIVEMRVQDVILPLSSVNYLVGVCSFIDDLLVKFYGLERFYNAEKKGDLVGKLLVGLAPHTSAAIVGRIIGFSKARAVLAHPYWHAAKRRNCDGDEDSVMMLMDVLINFSHAYLPETRGGRMDAPLVVNIKLDPNEVDDEAHCMEVVKRYPEGFYEMTQTPHSAKDYDIDIVSKHLDNNPYEGLDITHFSTWINAPTRSRYVTLGEMQEKADKELELCQKIRCVDVENVAKRLIDSHLIRDTYGNMRAFARQKFRCSKCNKKYRRVPLLGKCESCGGKLLLTVSKGTIGKYVELTEKIMDKYIESEYTKQRMELLKREIESIFENEKVKQYQLGDFA